jgi:release factor glutamine methyltransferase
MPVPDATGKQELLGLHDDMTLAEAVRTATGVLRTAGIESAPRDARALVAAASQRPALDLIAHPDAGLGTATADRLAQMIKRRVEREPVSRIIGEREFYGRAFKITPATLDPRPDTETLVDAALELCAEQGFLRQPIRILDIGTGSGCLIVTLLSELPVAHGVATDISQAALAVAAANADRHGVADRLRLRQADALEGIDDRYDLIVCNPPYIRSDDIPGLARDVRCYDPITALDGGSEGLQIFQRIAPRLQAVLGRSDNRGWALFEVGAGQIASVQRLFAANGFASFRTWVDLGGHTRCVAIQSLG